MASARPHSRRARGKRDALWPSPSLTSAGLGGPGLLPLSRGSSAALNTAPPGRRRARVRALLKAQTLPRAPRGCTDLLLLFPSLNVSLSLGPCTLQSDEGAGARAQGVWRPASQQSRARPSGRASRSGSPAGGHWAGRTTAPPTSATRATSAHCLLRPSQLSHKG